MRNSKGIFLAGMVVFVIAMVAYGLDRFRFGLDFTDEGAHLVWPLRISLGERPFAGELMNLVRPVEVYLAVLYRWNPEMSLYQFRLLGWTVHIAAYALFAGLLFRLSGAPLRSLLLAAVPLFGCHILGLATPSYNNLSADFLLVALVSWGLAARPGLGCRLWGALGGLAMFVSTMAHPGLALVAGALIVNEASRLMLNQGGSGRNMTGLRLGLLVWSAAWLAYGASCWWDGTLEIWRERMAMSRAPLPDHGNTGMFFGLLMLYPFSHSREIVVGSLLLVAAGAAVIALSRKKIGPSGGERIMLAAGILMLPTFVFAYLTAGLPLGLVAAGLLAGGFACAFPREPAEADHENIRALLLASMLAAVTYASLTYFYTFERSWLSGLLGLPFAFGAGATLISGRANGRAGLLPAVLSAAAMLLLFCAFNEHRLAIYRDAARPRLTAVFSLPKLRHIRSTPERVQVIEALHRSLAPRLRPGDDLLAYDDCPLIYYLFDARPAYGLAWAVRRGQSPATLARLNDELNAKPLPRYAIRALIDVSETDWASAPRMSYDDYLLNDTVQRHYVLEETIYPFEIWRRRDLN